MVTRFLESFVAFATGGSIAEAARRLDLSLAAMKQRFRALEAEPGLALNAHVGRNVRPTAAGMAALRRAPQFIHASRELPGDYLQILRRQIEVPCQ